MTEFMDMLLELLPVNSSIQKSDNPLRIVLDRSVGEFIDNWELPFPQLFLNTAEGKGLDVHGKDYNVPRKLDEDDDSYRERIIQEKLEYLTPYYLDIVYGLTVYTYIPDFNVENNTLTSDNPYIAGQGYMVEASDEIRNILENKFIIDNEVHFI